MSMSVCHVPCAFVFVVYALRSHNSDLPFLSAPRTVSVTAKVGIHACCVCSDPRVPNWARGSWCLISGWGSVHHRTTSHGHGVLDTLIISAGGSVSFAFVTFHAQFYSTLERQTRNLLGEWGVEIILVDLPMKQMTNEVILARWS
jgi:hypothetical protein